MPVTLSSSSWITEGSLPRAAWRLAVPMMAAALLQDLLAIVDMLFVGSLGPGAIAAVALCGTILGILYMLAVGVTAGCTALVAQAVGGGERQRAGTVTGQSLLMGAVLSVAVAAFGLPLAGAALDLLGADPEVIAQGTPYLQVSAAGSFTLFLGVAFGSALRGAGDAVTPLKVMAVANLVNAVLDPILIFGWLGMPALGVAGSAWASVIARLLSVVLLAWACFVRDHEQISLRLGDLRPHWPTIRQMLGIGVFGSGQMLTRNLSALALVRIVAVFGTVPLAAYGIGMRLRMVVMVPGMGLGNAAATLVGQNIGANRLDRAEQAGWLTAGMYAAVTVLITAVFLVLAEPLIAVFNARPEVVATGATYLRWLATSFVFISLSMVLGRAMNGAGDTFWPMVITGVSLLALRIPLAWGLAEAWHSVTGVWAALVVSNVLQGVLFVAAFRWGRWKRVGRSRARAAAVRAPDASPGGPASPGVTEPAGSA